MAPTDKGNTSKALYEQIVNEIREQIRSGSLTVGTRIPTEAELMQRYQVSRGTARQALGILENEGLLERIQGSGTFVRQTLAETTLHTSPTAPKMVGLILNQAGDELNIDILLGAEQAIKPREYQLSFAYSDDNAQQLALDIARLRTSTAGLIIFPVSNTIHDDAIAQLQADNFPFVLVDRSLPELECDYVGSDNLGGGYRAVEHLCILGHTRIGFAYSHQSSLLTTSARDRYEGYRQALRDYHIPYDEALVFSEVPYPPDNGPNACDAFLSRTDRPGAIFAINDAIALELLRAAQRCGLRVPEDLALVGFDNVSYAALLHPPLTTVAQQRVELGIRAGNLLLNRIEGQLIGPPRRIELPTNLMIRQSCGARSHLQRSAPAKP